MGAQQRPVSCRAHAAMRHLRVLPPVTIGGTSRRVRQMARAADRGSADLARLPRAGGGRGPPLASGRAAPTGRAYATAGPDGMRCRRQGRRRAAGHDEGPHP